MEAVMNDTQLQAEIKQQALEIGQAIMRLVAAGADQAGHVDKAAMARENGPQVIAMALDMAEGQFEVDPDLPAHKQAIPFFELAAQLALKELTSSF